MANQTDNINNTILSTVETIAEINQVLLGNLDDPAIWINGDDRNNSIIIGTLRDGGLATFNLDGTVKQNLTGSTLSDIRYNNVDVLYGFNLEEEIVDLVLASDRTNDTLAIFKVDSNSGDLVDITSDNILESIFGVDDSQATASGLAGYRSPITGQYYAFVSQANNNQIAQLELSSDSTGLVTANLIRTIDLPIAPGEEAQDYQSEAIVVDQEQGIVYVAPEDRLEIFKFSAEPNNGNEAISLLPLAPQEEDITNLFDNIVVFGDSLAEVGNVNIATDGEIFPSPPYNNGRATNGLNIVEIIAEDLGLSGSVSTPFLGGGDNYAFGGAEFGDGTSTLGSPNIGSQIGFYLGSNSPEARELFLIAAGANDIIANPTVNPQTLIDRLVEHISTLAAAGAESFGIFDIGPVGDTPTARVRGISDLAKATTSEFNTLLDATLDDLRLDLDINIYEFDSEGIYEEVQSNPISFGLTNILDPALDNELTVVPNPQEYFWWDTTHPTEAANTIFANAYIDQITNSPVQGDIEGLSIYYGGDGTGYLIASSESNSSFAVYSREGDNEYIGSFALTDNDALEIDRVNQSDGLDIVNVSLGDEFPLGLLVAQDDVNDSLANDSANFKLVPWDNVANALNPPLDIDTDSFDPLNSNTGEEQFDSIIYRFQNTSLPGSYLYVAEEERQKILQNFPNFTEEGEAFRVALEQADDLIAIYRFQNSALPGSYLYVAEEERQNILQNFTNFTEEGIAFYVYEASAGIGEDIYRFQNNALPGSYLYVGEEERENILQNFTNFTEEGVAFEVVI